MDIRSTLEKESKKFVAQLAELVKNYAEDLLRGDPTTYQVLREQQSHDALEYAKEIHLRAVRREAEAAWQQKNYEGVLKLYGSIQRDLTRSEFIKLRYAEKRLR